LPINQTMAAAPKPSPDQANNRRKRSRLRGATPGWIVPDGGDTNDPWEVRVKDVSRHGVGFESLEKMSDGEVCRIRIGRGPIELAKRVKIVRCEKGDRGVFDIGGEFV
jgi:hypothetical protein